MDQMITAWGLLKLAEDENLVSVVNGIPVVDFRRVKFTEADGKTMKEAAGMIMKKGIIITKRGRDVGPTLTVFRRLPLSFKRAQKHRDVRLVMRRGRMIRTSVENPDVEEIIRLASNGKKFDGLMLDNTPASKTSSKLLDLVLD